jgi:hypothetical protein
MLAWIGCGYCRLTAINSSSSNDSCLFPLIVIPLIFCRYTRKAVGKEKTQRNTMGLAGDGTSCRNSGVRRVDDYRRTHETVGRIEKPGEKLGSIFRAFTRVRFPHFVHPLPHGIFYATIEDSPG